MCMSDRASRGRVVRRLQTPSVGVSRTKQSFKKDCDINFILAQFIKGRQVDHLAKYGGKYGVVDAVDFHQAMNIVATAQEMFSDLPSDVRMRFSNDPGAFFNFARNPENLDEMRKMKLAPPAAVPEPDALACRLEELEVDRQARLEIARRAIVAPAAPHTVVT